MPIRESSKRPLATPVTEHSAPQQQVTVELLAAHGGIKDLSAWLRPQGRPATRQGIERVAEAKPAFHRAMSLPKPKGIKRQKPPESLILNGPSNLISNEQRSREMASLWAFAESYRNSDERQLHGEQVAAQRTNISFVTSTTQISGILSYPTQADHPRQESHQLSAAEVANVRSSASVQEVESGRKWLISVIDPRVMHTGAKFRRWAKDEQGRLYCALEFLPYERRPIEPNAEGSPGEYTRDLIHCPSTVAQNQWANMYPHQREVAVILHERRQLVDEALLELNTAAQLNEDFRFISLLQTEHERLIGICTNFVEEPGFVLAHVDQPTAAALGYTMYADVLRATAYLHDRNFIHGDQKANNWMYTDSGKVTLIDFEYARPLDTDGLARREGEVKTTWRPPELTDDDERMSKAGDLWAIAASFIYLYGYKEAEDKVPKADERALQRVSGELTECIRQMATEKFESLRQRIASQPRPAEAVGKASVAIDDDDREICRLLTGFARALPDLFAFAVRSQLNRDPSERASTARALSRIQQIADAHRLEIEPAQMHLRRALDESATNQVIRTLF